MNYNKRTAMEKFFISKNYRDKFTASSKAKMDAENIANLCGFKNIGLPQRNFSSLLGRIWTAISNIIGLMRIPRNGVMFAQYPSNVIDKQIKLVKNKGCKVIILIHDLNILRKIDNESIAPLKEADILIAHTESMKTWLLDNGFTQEIKVLGLFDYLTDGQVQNNENIENSQKVKVAFAGNLGKSNFLNSLTSNIVEYKLFGVGIDKIRKNYGVVYDGCYPPNILGSKLQSHFGLVWDGNSINKCDGINGEYLKYIAPHKISMYLANGLPVIIWNKSALAGFVKENNIGLIVSSLHEIEDKVKYIDKNEYMILKQNAEIVGKRLREGYYLSKILNNIQND